MRSRTACGDKIRYAIDCISTEDSQQLTQDVIAPSGGREGRHSAAQGRN